MINLDPLILSRIQFAFTVSFHIIFPAFTIGLSSFLAIVEWKWLKTNDERFLHIYKFWVKIFAVAFGMGVVSGVVMSYEFGTNWSAFSYRVGNVIGPLLGYEVLTAFFLEATFLGIMLFGWGRVSKKMHFTSTFIVAFGTLISAFWILSANSWMQTPQGFEIQADGRLFPTSWLEIIFNPSFHYRYIHMVAAAYLTTSFVVGGVGAFYLLKKKHIEYAKIMLSVATIIVIILAPLQVLFGDMHGLNTLEHQPLKIAAIEGLWNNEKGAGLRLFAIPDQENEKNNYEIKIPNLTSLILTHSMYGEVKGLKEWKKEDRPNVTVVFYAFRLMVALGLLMLLTALLSAYSFYRKKLFENRFLLRLWTLMIPSGFIAILSGWFVTEVGRQPYTVYGVLRTAESISPSIVGHQVAFSLLSFILMYSFVFGAGVYYIIKLISKGITKKEDSEQFYKHGINSTIIDIQ